MKACYIIQKDRLGPQGIANNSNRDSHALRPDGWLAGAKRPINIHYVHSGWNETGENRMKQTSGRNGSMKDPVNLPGPH